MSKLKELSISNMFENQTSRKKRNSFISVTKHVRWFWIISYPHIFGKFCLCGLWQSIPPLKLSTKNFFIKESILCPFSEICFSPWNQKTIIEDVKIQIWWEINVGVDEVNKNSNSNDDPFGIEFNERGKKINSLDHFIEKINYHCSLTVKCRLKISFK